MNLLQPFDIELSGINLVEASAGTGKTYNITSLYIRALIEKELPVSKILVVTYTEAATKELKDRILTRIGESLKTLQTGAVEDSSDEFLHQLIAEVSEPREAVVKLQQAMRSFDEAAIYTIHGFCYQALQEQAFESRAMFDAEMIGDDTELVQEVVDDYWRKWVSEASQNPEKKLLFGLLLDHNIGPESLARELGSYAGKPYLHTLPQEAPQITDFLSRVKELRSIFKELQSIWQNERSTLLKLLLSDGLNGRKYRSDYLENWFGYMDDFLESELTFLKPFKQFDNFTNSVLTENLNKGYDSPPEHSFFELADDYLSLCDQVMIFKTVFKKDLLDYLRRQLNKKKEELQVLAYDDLLLRLKDALLDSARGDRLAAKLRKKYPLAMVDEFQDTDPAQYEIFRTVYKNTEGALFMIGDPKQSIYSFRGADVYSYIKTRDDAPQRKRFRLDRNFRSIPNLLRGLNAFWGSHDNPFLLGNNIQYQEVTWGREEQDYKHFREHGRIRPPIRFRRLSAPGQDRKTKETVKKEAAKDTAREIYRLLEGGEKNEIMLGEEALQAKDIAVLVRRHEQANLMSEALGEFGIKSVRHSDQSVFESEEAGHVQQLLKAVADSTDDMQIKTALSLPLTDYSAAELLTLEEEDIRWGKMLQQFSDWHELWQDHGFAVMYRSVLNQLEIPKHVIGYPDGERRLTNLLHLGELLHKESRQNEEGIRGLLHWLAQKRKESKNGKSKSEEEQLRLESDEALVKIVTMHKSKGLQYPVVFCPFLWFGPHISDSGQPLTYHRPEDNKTAYLDLNGKADPERAQKHYFSLRENLAEDLRLAYVAMTRAQYSLYLSWDFANASEFSALGYLLQDPAEVRSLLKAKVGWGKAEECSADEMHNAIGELCTNHPDLFSLAEETERADKNQLSLSGIDQQQPELQARAFNRNTPLSTTYHISSFSSLSSRMKDDPDLPDYDQYFGNEEDIFSDAAADDERSIFSFPKGPQPGTCIHNIFEELDFSAPGESDQMIEEKLLETGIDTVWKPVVSQMLHTVVEKPLLGAESELRLAAIASEDLLAEMEFYYQNDNISSRELVSIIRNDSAAMSGPTGTASAGLLKGFIDLIFKFEGKYYILDYKTNYLGDSVSDYSRPELRQEIFSASYDLQYHIYTIALHRYLANNIPDYSYDVHFGGAFYLFLRGINQSGDEGIFFDRPDYQKIKELDGYIGGGHG